MKIIKRNIESKKMEQENWWYFFCKFSGMEEKLKIIERTRKRGDGKNRNTK
jgi:hypothetical protein